MKFLRFFSTFIKGQHSKVKEVSFHKGKEIKVAPNNKIALMIDGEALIIDHEVVFTIIPKGIKVVIPRSVRTA